MRLFKNSGRGPLCGVFLSAGSALSGETPTVTRATGVESLALDAQPVEPSRPEDGRWFVEWHNQAGERHRPEFSSLTAARGFEYLLTLAGTFCSEPRPVLRRVA